MDLGDDGVAQQRRRIAVSAQPPDPRLHHRVESAVSLGKFCDNFVRSAAQHSFRHAVGHCDLLPVVERDQRNWQRSPKNRPP